jgi:hypothetical protein
MTRPRSSRVGVGTIWSSAFRRLSPASRLVLVGMLAAIGLAGCASTPSTPSSPMATSSIASVTANPTVTPSPAPVLSPTPARPLSFVATGSMHTARDLATATLLTNGKVLIVGGEAQNDVSLAVYASAELYDPATGKFTSTGSMTAARAHATAIALSDGRVLIAGGQGCSKSKDCRSIFPGAEKDLVSAEIYNPATGKFTSTGSMTDVTRNSAAALLRDGKVLIVGQVNRAAELYDPATGTFARTSNVTSFDVPLTATVLADGKVLVTGDDGEELFDEASGKFTKISLTVPSGAPSAKFSDGSVIGRAPVYTATLLKDGRVLLFKSGYLETCDPLTGTCTDDGFISPGGEWIYPTATLLSDGRVLFVGGIVSSSPVGEFPSISSALLYDSSSGRVDTGSMTAARVGQTATLLPDGSVLIAGGGDANQSSPLSSAELFKP